MGASADAADRQAAATHSGSPYPADGAGSRCDVENHMQQHGSEPMAGAEAGLLRSAAGSAEPARPSGAASPAHVHRTAAGSAAPSGSEQGTHGDATATPQGEDDDGGAAGGSGRAARLASLAQRLALELNGLSQGGSPGGSQPYDDARGPRPGGGDDSADDTVNTAQQRPQRARRPRQYLAEQGYGTPPRSAGRSLPGTPGSSTRRRAPRGATTAARKRGGGVAALLAGQQQGGSGRHWHLSQQLRRAGSGSWAGGGSGSDGGGVDSGHDEDVEEGIDALLSLASLAHAASSSAATGSLLAAAGGGDEGDELRSRSGRPRRSSARPQAGSVGRRGRRGEQHGAGDSSGDDDVEDAAGGLAQLMRSSQGAAPGGWSTPRRGEGAGYIYRAGTPGGGGRPEFLLASPSGPAERLPPVPSPSGRRGRPLYGAAAASAAAAAAGGSTARSPGNARAARRGARRGGRRVGGSAVGQPREARSGRFATEGGVSVASQSDAEQLGSEGEPELMDAAELAAAASAGASLSSPHLRTVSANEPPRSLVLLGKRVGPDGGDDTPASHRSVRQRMAGDDGAAAGDGLPFLIPQPLFANGGAGAAAVVAAELVAGGSMAGTPGAASGVASPDRPGRKQRLRRGEHDDAGAGAAAITAAGVAPALSQPSVPAVAAAVPAVAQEGRGTRSSRQRRKAQPARNQRKPPRGGRGGVGARSAARAATDGASAELAPADALLRHMLCGRLRRWAAYEWHYSALDRPYFMRSEMQELLDVLGLSHVTHLPRGDWALLRAALGQPRRLSLAFLKQERMRLELHRERSRATYEALGPGGEVPPDLARPLRVSQAVVARHPVTRSLHDGIVLTTKPSRYRVQFNRAELLTHELRDVDVMPADPSECLPLSMLQPGMRLPVLLNGRPTPGPAAALHAAANANGGALARRRQLEAAAMAAAAAAAAGGVSAPQRPDMATSHADQQLLAELQGAVERKDALLTQLRSLNARAEAGGHLDADSGRPTEAFQADYAGVLSSLRAANTELAAVSAKVQARPHLSAAAAAAAAAAARSAGGDTGGASLLANGGMAHTGATLMRLEPGVGVVAAAAALLRDAAENARGAVCRARAERAERTEVPAGQQHQQQLDELLTSCVGVLLAVQLLTAPPGAAGNGAALACSTGGVDAALDAALGGLRPLSVQGAAALSGVTSSVARLKALLARAH